LPHDKERRVGDDFGNRRKIVQRIIWDALHDVGRHGNGAGGRQKQRIAVGIGFGDVIGPDCTVGARPVFDIEALPEQRGHFVCDESADEIGWPAGRESHHHPDGPAGIILRGGELRNGKR
jgi:hypothetical protein